MDSSEKPYAKRRSTLTVIALYSELSPLYHVEMLEKVGKGRRAATARFCPGIVLKTSYLRVFEWSGVHYSMARLGVLARAKSIEGPFEAGPNPFDASPYAGRVRHVALLVKSNKLYEFFSAIGDAPEKLLLSTIALSDDWKNWKASPPVEVLAPREPYECASLPVTPSRAGSVQRKQETVPVLFGLREQGIGGADVSSFIK